MLIHDLPSLNDPPQLSPKLEVSLKRCYQQFFILLQSSQLTAPLQETVPLQLLKLICCRTAIPARPAKEVYTNLSCMQGEAVIINEDRPSGNIKELSVLLLSLLHLQPLLGRG